MGSLLKPLLKKVNPVVGLRMLCMVRFANCWRWFNSIWFSSNDVSSWVLITFLTSRVGNYLVYLTKFENTTNLMAIMPF
jgi:hypothetical protein